MKLPGYQIEPEPAATGGQGSVYFGINPKGRAVALKVASSGQQARRALQLEIELVRHMNDAGVRGVVPVLDVPTLRDRPVMVMPRYPEHLGQWLKKVIRSPTAEALDQILNYLAQLARVLGRVHKVYYESGTVVHRDVKPENVFLDGRGNLFLADFGGAMAVEELRTVELAMFGTPMWAPLDQLLPGRAIPDTTWDTYACCVILYAAFTGARPAYQADPTELLTPAGKALWQAAKEAVGSSDGANGAAHRKFATMRRGTSATDLVDLTGRAALVDGDQAAIARGVLRLGQLAGLSDDVCQRLNRGLWNILVRGLSPLSHPSPPNRFRDADELADAIEDLRRLSRRPKKEAKKNNNLDDLLFSAHQGSHTDSTRTTLSAGPPLLLFAVVIAGLLFAAIAAYLGWPTVQRAFNANRALPDRVAVEGGSVTLPAGAVVVKSFDLDTTEVPAAVWRRCIDEKKCDPPDNFPVDPQTPASPLRFADASAICAFRGGTVPSEAQWIKAHGPTTYPWGDAAPTCDQAVALGCVDQLAHVGAARQGGSASGAIDMAGNVWEWARGVDGPILLGGGMTSSAKQLGANGRREVPADTRPALSGVRCAYSP